MSIDQVQRWVVSVLIFAISAFPIGGLFGIAHAVRNEGRHGDAVGFIVMAGVIGVIAFGAIRILHKRSVVTPLLILGTLPAAIAAFVLFR
jgi:hypothetical protein